MIRLREDAMLERAFPVMRQLRTHIPDAREFIRRVREGEEKAGYILFGLEDAPGDVVALCGVQPMVTLYYDNCLWVCDLVADEARRSRGHGGRLLGEVQDWARANGYREISLSSGVQRLDAHRFYREKMGYGMSSHVFFRGLSRDGD